MKKLSMLLVIVFVLSMGFSVLADEEGGETEKTYSQGYDDGYDEGYSAGKSSVTSKTPIVRVVETLDTPEVEAGQRLEIKSTFRNESDYSAYALSITPQIEDSKVLIYERPLSFKTLTPLRSKKEINTSFTFKTAEDAKAGTYALKFKVEYKNTTGEVFTREEVAYYKINNDKSKPILNIQNIKYNRKDIAYGDSFAINFDIVNIGGSDAEETEITLSGFDTNTIMPISSKDYKFIGTIGTNEPGKTAVSNQTFEFKVSPEIEVRDVVITAKITYKSSYEDKEYDLTKAFYITDITPKPKESGEKKEEEKKEDPKYAKPKMIITSYNTSSSNIIAGDTFSFSFSCKNTSREKDIRNIKITVGTSEGSFIITNGSNTFYIESLEKQGSISRNLNLRAKQDLLSNSYPIIIDFEYEDYDGVEYSSKETVNIPVTEYSRLVINSANVDTAYIGTNTSLSFEYANMGKAVISNLVATCKGDFVPVQENNYIGNIQAGSSDNYDIEVKATKVGKNFGTLILIFEDSSGRQIEVTRDFEAEAMEEEMINPMDMLDIGDINEEPAEEPTIFKTWQIVLAGFGSLLVSFIVARFITKKIILKKFEDEL